MMMSKEYVYLISFQFLQEEALHYTRLYNHLIQQVNDWYNQNHDYDMCDTIPTKEDENSRNEYAGQAKQSKAKQSKAKQSKAKQSKAKQSKAKQSKAK
jgi:type II secretory pathway pseudopilin PulG